MAKINVKEKAKKYGNDKILKGILGFTAPYFAELSATDYEKGYNDCLDDNKDIYQALVILVDLCDYLKLDDTYYKEIVTAKRIIKEKGL